MSPDDQVRVSVRDVAADVALAILLHRASQQNDPVSRTLQNAARVEVMLLRQDFGRCHQGDLAAVLDRDNRGFKGNDRLPGTHIALQ